MNVCVLNGVVMKKRRREGNEMGEFARAFFGSSFLSAQGSSGHIRAQGLLLLM